MAGGLWKEALQKNAEADPKSVLLVSVNIVTQVLNLSAEDIGMSML